MGGRGANSASSKKIYNLVLKADKKENFHIKKDKKKERIKRIKAPKGYKAVDYEQNIRYFEKDASNFKGVMNGKPNSVYVLMSKDKIKSIVYFDNKGKRRKQIDFDHIHEKNMPHVHIGYKHNRNSPSRKPNDKEKKMMARSQKKWYNTYRR